MKVSPPTGQDNTRRSGSESAGKSDQDPSGRTVRICIKCGAWIAAYHDDEICTPCGRQRDRPPFLPSAEWRTRTMRTALASRDMAAVVRSYRHHPAHGARPIPQAEMAQWLGITQGQLSRLENGRSRIHDLDKLTHYARVLAIPSTLLWFDTEKEPEDRPTAGRVRLPSGRSVDITALGPDPGLADSLLINLEQYVRADVGVGPHTLLPVVEAQVRVIEELHRSGDGPARRKFRHVHARYAEFLGWLHQDAGNFRQATDWSNIAFTLAHELDDARLKSYVRMRQSNLAEDLGAARPVLELAEQARRHTDSSMPRLRALALRQHARGQARLGRPQECARSIEMAAAYTEEAGDEDSDLAGYCTAEFIAVEAADCWIEIGRTDSAIESLETALTHWQSTNRRDFGRGLALLARAQARTEQHDDALATARQALLIASETGSERIGHQIRRAATELVTAGADEHGTALRSALRTALP